ncbi:MAG: heavy-metal-associated domain-containing protein [Verrucomicrobiales bacterium]|nr:heavy-metal-associated domain-containing protein [Verrucomicrobiae bacterium]MCP5553482.1 heavy-metal-associated domain-containing protein [Akkermansiaceae bacterium]HRX53411.1 heavy-metal-associated domain-containing protein [Verrucomicrobiales bacterium]
MRTTIALCLCWVLCAALPAPELLAGEQTATFRLIGLSHPEREEDFHQVMQSLPDLKLERWDAAKAEVTLRYDTARLFPTSKPDQVFPPEKILEHLDKLIGQASNRTFSLTAPLSVQDSELTKVEIPCGFLDCKGCRYAVYLAVAKTEGVARASVSSETGVLTAWIETGKTNRETLIEALKKARVELP